jgi:deoxyxylulose-5-phosphate synthase
MFNLMAITSRSGHLTKQVATLTKAIEEGQARGESDEWVNAQLDEAKNKLARIEDQFKEWDVSTRLP